jgi:hypothetical protein
MLRIYEILPSPENAFEDVIRLCCWKTVSSPIRLDFGRSTLGRRELAFAQAGLI